LLNKLAVVNDTTNLKECIQKYKKPRDVTIESFYGTIESHVEACNLLPGDIPKLMEPEKYRIFFNGMPQAWHTTKLVLNIKLYMVNQEHTSNATIEANIAKQCTATAKCCNDDRTSGAPAAAIQKHYKCQKNEINKTPKEMADLAVLEKQFCFAHP